MKTYSIYTLNHPITNEIRYVGQTCQTLENRLKRHLNSKDNSYRVNWIKSLANEGLTPKIVLIKDNLTKEETNELERFYIKEYRNNGLRLINLTDGGEGSVGFKHSDISKAKLSLIRQKLNTEEHKEYLRTCGVKQWENTSNDDKLNNILIQPTRKNIYQYDLQGNLINEFISLRQIERELGYFRGNITPCLKGDFKQAYGFIWKYLKT